MIDTATHQDAPVRQAPKSLSPVQQCAVALASVYTLFTAGIMLMAPELRLAPLPWALWALMLVGGALTFRVAARMPSRRVAAPRRQSRRTRKWLAADRV